ncbi:MAG: ATP-binding protein [Eikenella corrodens]|uniref:ATP-binding protein n=1 Tax=Eikenella corrodens TaxID=539 RepID=UPI0012AC5F39|nr:ATP-binding protein [Eikenella corrodens]MDU4299868.1 ATP-binding protein [Eikenella corrodens]
MIITKVTIHNLFNFDHAELDLTIPKKVVNSTIPFEYLEGRESFRYRRVCILSGANASGKSSFGQILNGLQFAVAGGILATAQEFRRCIYNQRQNATCSIEFATPADHRLHTLQITLFPDDPNPEVVYAATYIEATASSRKARERLSKVLAGETVPHSTLLHSSSTAADTYLSIVNALNKVPDFGWEYHVNHTMAPSAHTWRAEPSDAPLFSRVLKTYDPAILDVVKIRDDTGFAGFSIRFMNDDDVILNKKGEITNGDRLSRGTLEAITVACMLARIIRDRPALPTCHTYFLDEAMAYAHSELEIAMLNLLIEKLGRNAQLFYTTHNYDVLAMNMPVHSFAFLKKERDKATFVQPEVVFKKNDRNLLNYVKNDVFSTLPNIDKLDEILWEE